MTKPPRPRPDPRFCIPGSNEPVVWRNPQHSATSEANKDAEQPVATVTVSYDPETNQFTGEIAGKVASCGDTAYDALRMVADAWELLDRTEVTE